MSNRIGEIELQIMWNRLLSVVEEQAQTLVRTAFSTSSREAGDISAGVFDLNGRMLAQAVTGTPGHDELREIWKSDRNRSHLSKNG